MSVQMVFATLTRRGCREQHDGRMRHEIGHERSCPRSGQMLGDFQALRQIEPTTEIVVSGKVMCDEASWGDLELVAVDVLAVHADSVSDALGLPFS